MLSETQKVLDFIGGAERDRTADLLNAMKLDNTTSSIACLHVNPLMMPFAFSTNIPTLRTPDLFDA